MASQRLACEWLLRPKGRGESGAFTLNFLWRSEQGLYVMDNHLAAIWCWWQHLGDGKSWNLLHIDYHSDTNQANLRELLPSVPAKNCSLDEFLRAEDPLIERCPLFSWNNYLSIFLAQEGHRLGRVVFSTAGSRDKPNFEAIEEVGPWGVLPFLESICKGEETSHNPWIVNLDLDYFTQGIGQDAATLRVFSWEYIEAVGQYLASGLRSGAIACATIATSPETTGSWEDAELILGRILGPWGAVPDLAESSNGVDAT